jgi:hypothetical protein
MERQDAQVYPGCRLDREGEEMSALNIEAFAQLADAYGGDLQRWPEHHRAEALALLTRSDAAQALLREAAGLDAALGEPSPAPSLQALRARILNSVPRQASAARPALAPRRSLWRALWLELGGMRWVGPALAAALTLGVGLDQMVATDWVGPQADTDLISLALLDDDDEELLP